MPISPEVQEIFKKFKKWQVGRDVGCHHAQSVRADLHNEEMRELRIKRSVLIENKNGSKTPQGVLKNDQSSQSKMIQMVCNIYISIFRKIRSF